MPNATSFPLWAVAITVTVLIGVAVMAVRGRKKRRWWQGDQVSSAEVSKYRKLRLKLRQRHQFE